MREKGAFIETPSVQETVERRRRAARSNTAPPHVRRGPTPWGQVARDELIRLAITRRTFIAEDLHKRLVKLGAMSDADARVFALGPILRWGVRGGFVEKTNRLKRTASQHSVYVYESRVYLPKSKRP